MFHRCLTNRYGESRRHEKRSCNIVERITDNETLLAQLRCMVLLSPSCFISSLKIHYCPALSGLNSFWTAVGYTQWLLLLLFRFIQVPCPNFKNKSLSESAVRMGWLVGWLVAPGRVATGVPIFKSLV